MVHDCLTAENLAVIYAKLVPVRGSNSAHPSSLRTSGRHDQTFHLPTFLHLFVAGRVHHTSSFKQSALAWKFQAVRNLLVQASCFLHLRVHVQQPTEASMETVPTHTEHLDSNGAIVSLGITYPAMAGDSTAAYPNLEVVIDVAPFAGELIFYSFEARQVHHRLMLISIIVVLICLQHAGSG